MKLTPQHPLSSPPQLPSSDPLTHMGSQYQAQHLYLIESASEDFISNLDAIIKIVFELPHHIR